MGTTVSYYHYTTADAARKIDKSKTIRASGLNTPDDKHFGPGSYFTRMDPESHTKLEVAENNWGNGAEQAIKDGKLEWVVKVDINPKEMKKGKGRDVWIYEGDVDLTKYNHAIWKCKFKE